MPSKKKPNKIVKKTIKKKSPRSARSLVDNEQKEKDHDFQATTVGVMSAGEYAKDCAASASYVADAYEQGRRDMAWFVAKMTVLGSAVFWIIWALMK